MEGLSALVKKPVKLDDFVDFNVNSNCFIGSLQFPDDTLLVGYGFWKHIWNIKSVLMDLELASGLGINFNKSKLIGININPDFLEAAATFLSCKTEEKIQYPMYPNWV